MKTAVSVPNDVFQQVERLAKRAGRSRSEVYSAALREYVARHAPDEVTETLNHTMDQLGDDASLDPFVRQGSRRTLDAAEW
jgi:metal-responsive CopG/Arc/MetJ family transcriptional regulator